MSRGGKGGGPVVIEGGAGGTEPEGTSGQAGEAPALPPADEEAPRVLATSPANGAHGVRSDAEIRVTFSERMDNASVEAAFRSEDFPEAKLLWDKDSTELVIQPGAPLAYADGSEPNAPAKFFSFTIGGTAKDAAGNEMGDERTFVFTTLRHLQHSIAIPSRWARKLFHPADGTADEQAVGCPSSDALLNAGDKDDDTALAFAFAFDLGALPRGAVEWAKAELRVSGLGATETNPYSRLGPLLGFVIATPLANVLWDVPTTADLGAAVEYRSLDHFDKNVLEFVPPAYEGGTPLEFLFQFKTPTDGDGDDAYAVVRCGNIELELEYWAP